VSREATRPSRRGILGAALAAAAALLGFRIRRGSAVPAAAAPAKKRRRPWIGHYH
jgi:hypothetical protein